MSTTLLTSVFLKKQENLKDALKSIELPKGYAELQKVVYNFIESLLISDNDFRNSLNASDAEMLTSALRMSLSFQKISLADKIDFKALSLQTEYKVTPVGGKNEIIENAITLLPAVVCAFYSPWLAVAVGLGTVGAKKVYYRRKNGRDYIIQEIPKDISRKITSKEIDAILSGLESLCNEIDEIIAKIQRDRKDLLAQMQNKQDGYTLENMYPQILTSLQYLFMEDLKNGTKNQYLQNMLFCLQGYGYELVEYSLANSGFFTKKNNPNVADETMYLPAIIKNVEGTKVIAASGVVYVPTK